MPNLEIISYQALTALYQLSNAGGRTSVLAFHRGLVVAMNDDGLAAILDIIEDSLSSLFRRTFGNYEQFTKVIGLAVLQEGGALFVRNKLYRHGLIGAAST